MLRKRRRTVLGKARQGRGTPMNKLMVASAGLLALALFLPARSFGMSFTADSTKPVDRIIAGYDIPSTNNCQDFGTWTDDGLGHQDMGQSFSLPGTQDYLLDTVTVRLGWWDYGIEGRPFGAAVLGAAYHIDIWLMADFVSPGDTTGDVLISRQTAILPSVAAALGNPLDYWTFDIADVSLAAGKQYAFLFGFDEGPDTARYVYVNRAWGDYYSGGRTVLRTGTPLQWSSYVRDLDFAVQGETIPEPASILLLATSIIGIGVRLRRRRRKT